MSVATVLGVGYWHAGVFVAIAGALKLSMVLVILFMFVLGNFDFLIPCS